MKTKSDSDDKYLKSRQLALALILRWKDEDSKNFGRATKSKTVQNISDTAFIDVYTFKNKTIEMLNDCTHVALTQKMSIHSI